MDAEQVEQIKDISKPARANDSKLGEARNIRKFKGLKCLYSKDRMCRVPFCDSNICAKCPRGCVFCVQGSTNPLRKLLHKVMGIIVFLAAFVVEESVLCEVCGKFFRII